MQNEMFRKAKNKVKSKSVYGSYEWIVGYSIKCVSISSLEIRSVLNEAWAGCMLPYTRFTEKTNENLNIPNPPHPLIKLSLLPYSLDLHLIFSLYSHSKSLILSLNKAQLWRTGKQNEPQPITKPRKARS